MVWIAAAAAKPHRIFFMLLEGRCGVLFDLKCMLLIADVGSLLFCGACQAVCLWIFCRKKTVR